MTFRQAENRVPVIARMVSQPGSAFLALLGLGA